MENTLHTHGEDVNGHRFTLAAVTTNDVTNYGLAICSTKDNFNKKLGRIISSGRAISDPIKFITNNDKLNIKDTLFSLKKDIQEKGVENYMKRNRCEV